MTLQTLARRRLVMDGGLALVAFALTLALLGAGGVGDEAEARDLDALGVVLAALTTLPLAAWRRSPLGIFALTAAASSIVNGLGYGDGPPIGPTVALYLLAARGDEKRPGVRLAGLVVVPLLALHVAAAGIGDDRFPGAELVLGTLLWGGVWLVGERTRLRRERIAALEERALRAEQEAERERRLAAAEERTRIARDLHDSAGHAINVILVQAGAARLLVGQDPERASKALQTIEDVARDTVREIDDLVGALREDDSEAVEPPASLAALETLLERHRAAGLEVTTRIRGADRPLPRNVDRASYRILQEALTNAARHGAGRAAVEIEFGSSALELTVTNPAATGGNGAAGGGHGVIGMRERAALLGGSLEAGSDDGVFRVRARLPYHEEEA